MGRANIFVIGMDEENLDTLRRVPHAEQYNLHPLLTIEELQYGEIRVADLLEKAKAQLDAFDGTIDAVVGYWDFPVSTLVPILSERYGLRSTSLESILKCEHKYWSRLVQREVIDEHPRFALVDLDGEPEPPAGLNFPMWLKPVKSFSSELAFGVADEEEFRAAVGEIREGISRVGKPFEYILDRVDLPPEITAAGGAACLAEETLTGEQYAVEGYVYDGEVVVYGTLDSIDYENSASFLRHQYPSRLPERVVRRLEDVSQRVMRHIGTNWATFSIEFFYDKETDEVNLLEINPRHSQSHAELFESVDGVPNHHCMFSLALGRDPALPRGKGPYRTAAKWYYRRFEDGVARRVPTPEEVARLESEIPGVKIEIVPEEGQRLSGMPGQDSYSFELAHIFIGADSETELCEKYERCTDALHFEFDASEGAAR
ncbi:MULTISPECIES: acetyl-CoA carboxylase biotin carboxylase subunit family protein [Streptomyces]|uniref:ATP-grasp domain-containing protein n=1 Tax=Streptomyces lycii TaxID=2654337 RepID=A0ABQ7FJX1_9ACTN|nr:MULTISPECIES: ATP-grasp domain-containing protein [Streptomyces]KAF4407527.1 ATP-grasp domain-containing protein [Streptomyces lycii]PGH52223.1 biotin carboxylase [Streptomyces sp. Ru87]